ncbi:DUF2390 domain-containing protein [Ferrimonas lipolytica]|uniref:DUF2390 domain-containing protein n=1 Tax=Ferrimonas lipolytica TaxID=2724191 RepID=A0A6H1UI01_9GAMM|nr:DUF2390 domain-containing protein [Ferrimonas lipolytica]QIZ77846.1 DUF2390 domain-containing protein [Ferrimonas lipolytica]
MVRVAGSDRTADGVEPSIDLQGFVAFGDSQWHNKTLRALALRLQDEHQLEPNLLLLAIFLSSKGQFVDSDDFKQIALAQQPFATEVLSPYRELRRLAKKHLVETDYRRMLEVELILERHSQKLIVGAYKGITPKATGNNGAALLAAHQWYETPLPADLAEQLQLCIGSVDL